jgi:hypothetical protein
MKDSTKNVLKLVAKVIIGTLTALLTALGANAQLSLW